MQKFLENLEDPEKPLLGPNYWCLKKSGIILPENKLAKIAYLCIDVLATFGFVLSQYVELFVTKSDLDFVLTNLKISMLSTVCVIKSNTCVLWQDKWKQVINYVTEADQFERDNRDPVRSKILDAYTQYSRRVTYFYWSLVFTTSVTITCQPLLIHLTSPREEFRNTTEFPHMFSTWMPFDKDTSPGCWITVLWQVFICTYGATVVAGYDTTAIVIMVFFGGKMELLRERCKRMLGSSGRGVSNEEAEEAIRQLHTIHVMLTKHSRLFNSLLSPVMFLYVVMCTLMLCASAFQLNNAQSMVQKLLMVEYLVFGIAQLFMFCWHSNDVLAKIEQISLGPYESTWWTAPVSQKKSILILAGQLRIVHNFTAGPFTDLTLTTFLAILKGAYSYYTLLRK